MLSFEPNPAVVAPEALMRRLRLITPALSLGHIETTICSPVKTSHARMSPAARQKMGVTDALLHLSVGIEDVADLIADIDQALKP